MMRRGRRIVGLGLALAAAPVALPAQTVTGEGAPAAEVGEGPRPVPRPAAPLYTAPPLPSPTLAPESRGATPPLSTPTISEPTVETPSAASSDGRTAPAILIVDRDRVLRESAPARALAERERRAQKERFEALEALRSDLEAEEAEIAALRETAPSGVFEERVRVFDERVRAARRTSQAKGEALQRRFVEARRGLAEALQPVLVEILKETGAALIVDARNALAARAGADFTEEAIRRVDVQTETSPPSAPEAGSTRGAGGAEQGG